ncbi:hypothetical protein [Malonomonas rubra]|nr:hypothetical protein [Malonomonas rubra]
MKNVYRAIVDAACGFFHHEPEAIRLSLRSRRSLRWLSLHTRNDRKLW